MNSDFCAIQKALENNWEEAAIINQQILDQNPLDINALNRLTYAFIQLNQLEKAKSACKQIFNLDENNPIAVKNLNKISILSKNKDYRLCVSNNRKIINFIEEPGKSKVIPLVRIGDNNVVSMLQPCLELDIKIRKQSICFYYQQKYVGKLPDDIAKRLIWLSKRSNRYQAIIKSINVNRVTVFVKESKQSGKNQSYQSFID